MSAFAFITKSVKIVFAYIWI